MSRWSGFSVVAPTRFTRIRKGGGLPIDADSNQHRMAGDDAGLAHPLIARVEDQWAELVLTSPINSYRGKGEGGHKSDETTPCALQKILLVLAQIGQSCAR
jgi:hypothetical protein